MRARVLVACAAVLLTACFPRRLVTRPALDVTVLDASGAPVSGADVVVFWWSYPYGQLRETHPFVSDTAGRLVATEVVDRELIAPLCMHGVPEHHYFLCVGAAGQGIQAVDIDPSGATTTIRLPGGAYAGECAAWDEFRAKDALHKR